MLEPAYKNHSKPDQNCPKKVANFTLIVPTLLWPYKTKKNPTKPKSKKESFSLNITDTDVKSKNRRNPKFLDPRSFLKTQKIINFDMQLKESTCNPGIKGNKRRRFEQFKTKILKKFPF